MTPSARSRRAWRFAHVLLTMSLGTAVGACFNPPSDAVLFACDANTAPSCPAGYSCADDGCCHRDGSDIEADFGSCRIGGAMSATDNPTSSGATSTGSESTGSASTGPTSSSSTSSSADTGSSDAGTTT